MEPRPIDHVERAHLRDERGFSPPVHRLVPSPDLADHVRRYWLPGLVAAAGRGDRAASAAVPRLPARRHQRRRDPGRTDLGNLRPRADRLRLGGRRDAAAGRRHLGRGPSGRPGGRPGAADHRRDRRGRRAADRRVRAAIGDAAADPDVRMQAVLVMEQALRALPPVDEEGRLVNAIVEYVEGDSEVQRVSQVCEKFAITERSLQRLTRAPDRARPEVADPAPPAPRGRRTPARTGAARPGPGRHRPRLQRPSPPHPRLPHGDRPHAR